MKNILRKTRKILSSISNELVFYELNSCHCKMNENIKIITNLKELEEFCRFHEYSKNNYIEGRFEKGDIFVAMLDKGSCVSSGWIASNRNFYISEIDSIYHIDKTTAILYDFYTEKNFRGKGYYPLLLKSIISEYDYEKFIIYALKQNTASRKGIEKAGFIKMFSVNVILKHKLLQL